MTAYARGAARERDLVKLLRAEGYSVNRTPGSHGVADVIALKAGYVSQLIQLKTDKAGAFAHFGPAARRELAEEARRAGARAVLVWWPGDRKGPRFLREKDWPR